MARNSTNNNKQKRTAILINTVFAGGYAYNKNNLPHEVINFFRADNDNFYISTTPSSVIDADIQLETIIFVRSTNTPGWVEVLAKADTDEEIETFVKNVKLYQGGNVKDIGDYVERINNEEKNNGAISYNKKSIQEIHKNNAHDNQIVVTMKVKSICLPKKTFYLKTNGPDDEISTNIFKDKNLTGKKIANQSMRMYLYKKDNDYYFEGSAKGKNKKSHLINTKLKEIIDDTNREYWKTQDETPKLDQKSLKELKPNFFKITRQQDNEVMFSNMFYYLFSSYPKLMVNFINCISNNIINVDENSIIEREKEHMDLRIIDDKNYIIIENKIKSGINGLKKDKETNDFKKDEKEKYRSQLSDYYAAAEERNTADKKDRKIQGFIFVPDYNPITEKYLKKYSCGNSYKPIAYSTISDFFNNYKDLEDIYFEDFKKAIKKHTESVDDEFRQELMQRFIDRTN